jgi:hypothetical protein
MHKWAWGGGGKVNQRERKMIRVQKWVLASGLGILSTTVLGLGGVAQATLNFQVLNSTAPSGGSGSFDVVFNETSGGADGGSTAVGAFEVELLAPSGISFTGTGTNTSSAGYIFGGLQTPPFTTNSFPNSDFTASDIDQTLPYEVDLNSGDEFGAEHVTYSVAKGTAAKVLTVNFGANTGVDDAVGPIDFTAVTGTITVTAVPEPAGIGLLAAAGGMLLRRRRATNCR